MQLCSVSCMVRRRTATVSGSDHESECLATLTSEAVMNRDGMASISRCIETRADHSVGLGHVPGGVWGRAARDPLSSTLPRLVGFTGWLFESLSKPSCVLVLYSLSACLPAYLKIDAQQQYGKRKY